MKNKKIIIDYLELTNLFDEKYKQTKQIIDNGNTYLDNLAEGFTEADKIIRQLLTIDAVEVVRCKDCRFRIDDINFVRGHYCMKRPSNGGYYCEDNDFCSYGERKDNVI